MRTLALNLCYLPFSLPGCLNLGLIVALYPLNFRQSCRPVQPCGVAISGCHFFNGLRSAVIAAVLPSLHPENFHYKPLATGSAEQGLTQPPHGKRRQIRVGIIRDGGKNKTQHLRGFVAFYRCRQPGSSLRRFPAVVAVTCHFREIVLLELFSRVATPPKNIRIASFVSALTNLVLSQS